MDADGWQPMDNRLDNHKSNNFFLSHLFTVQIMDADAQEIADAGEEFNFAELPNELIFEVIAYCDGFDVLKLGNTCRFLRDFLLKTESDREVDANATFCFDEMEEVLDHTSSDGSSDSSGSMDKGTDTSSRVRQKTSSDYLLSRWVKAQGLEALFEHVEWTGPKTLPRLLPPLTLVDRIRDKLPLRMCAQTFVQSIFNQFLVPRNDRSIKNVFRGAWDALGSDHVYQLRRAWFSSDEVRQVYMFKAAAAYFPEILDHFPEFMLYVTWPFQGESMKQLWMASRWFDGFRTHKELADNVCSDVKNIFPQYYTLFNIDRNHWQRLFDEARITSTVFDSKKPPTVSDEEYCNARGFGHETVEEAFIEFLELYFPTHQALFHLAQITKNLSFDDVAWSSIRRKIGPEFLDRKLEYWDAVEGQEVIEGVKLEYVSRKQVLDSSEHDFFLAF
jgi:hypothetical protein